MKCAVFLLALWAFETGFAAPSIEDQLWIAQLENVGYVEKRAKHFIDANTLKIQREQQKNEEVSQCMNECHEFQAYFNGPILGGVYACHIHAIEHKNLKKAEDCYTLQKKALQTEISRRCINIATCIADILTGYPYNAPAAEQEAGPSKSKKSRNG